MSSKHDPRATEHSNRLIQFRQAAYGLFGAARAALFEVSDAALTTPTAQSRAQFSRSRYFRRSWPSVYVALQDGRPQREKLMQLYSQQVTVKDRPILAGDHTAWPRPTAYTLRDRTVEHQPTPAPGNRPVTVTLGHGYSSLVWVPEAKGSWALPLLHERIAPTASAFDKAQQQQLQQVAKQLRVRASEVLPMTVKYQTNKLSNCSRPYPAPSPTINSTRAFCGLRSWAKMAPARRRAMPPPA